MSADSTADPWARYRGYEAVTIRASVRVGQIRTTFAELSRLEAGDVLTLDRPVGGAFELVAGGRVLGRVGPVTIGEDVAFKLLAAVTDEDESDG
ncbi:MAG: FliM/FliN family flagellar motor switch protein [bacterium]|nr:FliM/FliN family flagellar motor switch protein [bacterium]